MNQKQLKLMQAAKGFIAALDQSGGSTPKALSQYGISPDSYDSEEQMFNLVHEMRARIIRSPSFTKEKILGVILFERTMGSFILKINILQTFSGKKKRDSAFFKNRQRSR